MPRRRQEDEYDEDDDFEDEDLDVHEILEEALRHPKIGGLFSSVARTIDKFSRVIDQVAQYTGPPPRPGSPGPRPKPTPQRIDPYLVLGLARDVPLTEQLIKERRRELARLFHSDKGGNDEAMKRVNVAADLLLQKIQGAKP